VTHTAPLTKSGSRSPRERGRVSADSSGRRVDRDRRARQPVLLGVACFLGLLGLGVGGCERRPVFNLVEAVEPPCPVHERHVLVALVDLGAELGLGLAVRQLSGDQLGGPGLRELGLPVRLRERRPVLVPQGTKPRGPWPGGPGGLRLGIVPPRVVDPLTREAARRRAVNTLRVAEAVARYGAEAVGNGLGPEEARRAAVEVAVELEHVAATLRRLARTARLDPAGRRVLVVDLAASGLSQRAIAARLGVSKRTVFDDLRRAGFIYPGSPRY
jgi:Homeodomain-like domain